MTTSEKRIGALWFLAFIGWLLIAASPFGESMEHLLMYAAVPLFVLLNVLAILSWSRTRNNEIGPTHAGRLEAFLRKMPPL